MRDLLTPALPFLMLLLACTASGCGGDGGATGADTAGDAATDGTGADVDDPTGDGSDTGPLGTDADAPEDGADDDGADAGHERAGDDGADGENPAEPVELTVITFNVLCSFCDRDGYHPWAERLAVQQEMLAAYDADLIGIQELVFADEDNDEVSAMTAAHDVYKPLYYISESAAELLRSYPDATIYYRADRFDLIEHGYIWLSPTPDVSYSTGFVEPQLPRLVGWAVLHDLVADRELLFANTHFDPNNPSQALSVPLVHERLGDRFAELPTVFVGDFNAAPDSEAYELLTTDEDHALADTYDLATERTVWRPDEETPEYIAEERIDHVFVSPGDWQVDEWLVDLRRFGTPPLFPSDHRLILARLRY